MTGYRNILKVLACGLPLPALLLTGCSDIFTDNVVDCGSEEVATSSSYIQLSLSQASSNATRSADNPPKGGELGDGTEKGQQYENVVTSAALFLYAGDASTRVNTADPSTPVTMVQFTSFEQTTDERPYDNIAVSAPQSVDLDNGTYRVIAIANPKDLTWAQKDNLTLGDVRDHIEKVAWTESSGTYSSFLMTSENDEKGSIITLEDNTRDDPATTFVEVERMAARVDYQATGEFTITNDGGEGEGDATYEGATVDITGATIVNNLTAGSYELKRTNSGYGSTTVTYLGDETADGTTSIATNYVIDPWTDVKDGQTTSITIDGVSGKEIKDLYGVYYPGIATDGDEQNPSYWADLVTAGTPVTVDDETWNIVGYTMENTTYADYTSKDYSTAIVFGAKFTPAEGTVVNNYYQDSFGELLYPFAYGDSTFFRWNNTLYATPFDMMDAVYPEVFKSSGFDESTFSDIEDKDGLESFIATLSDNDPTGYKAYLQGIADEDKGYPTVDWTATTVVKDSLYWLNYMANRLHFTTSQIWVNADKSGMWGLTILVLGTDTRALLYEATNGAVRTYENSQCYYTWWIRHSNDDSDETNGVMEYSIVRNNIYKIRVVSVYSIGGDIPDEGVRVYVYVKDWTMLDEEAIDM